MVAINLLVVDRDTLCYVLGLERLFVDRWLRSGEPPIPALPVLSGIGKAAKFHLPTVEAWLLKWFMTDGTPRGGKKEAAKARWSSSVEHERRHLVKPGSKEARCGAQAMRWLACEDGEKCATCNKRGEVKQVFRGSPP